ncbi:DUF2625 domain-containing protein [Lewinella sp. IMCC34191]|uniref:DUF2625 domain-containing protein n=1 Tax=Lewinella sp. IMCC34191 TaxID=2259172 RepID=UPI000E21C8E1|nr:DUF2625 domain-containing protein [Lewinella sp. IMCC34191]
MRPLTELINLEEPGWEVVEEWITSATNKVEILPKNEQRAGSALYRTQVTTRSPMGAIIYETGGILVDHGWIRILGSGSDRLSRSLPEWNRGKSFEAYGKAASFLLIADDAIGGFFALNGGAFGDDDMGMVYYLSPDNLEWEPLDIGYSDFVYWAFTNDLDAFYEGLRWKRWKKEVKEMGADRAMLFYPFLWTAYDLEKRSKNDVPIEEIWTLQLDVRDQLKPSGEK